MHRDNLADTSHRGGVELARNGDLEGAQHSLTVAFDRAQNAFLEAARDDKSALAAQRADIQADIGNVLRLSAVVMDEDQPRVETFTAAYSQLSSAELETSFIVGALQSAPGARNREFSRKLREIQAVNGKVLSSLGRLALTIQVSDGIPVRDQVMGRLRGRRHFFAEAQRHLRAGDSGINRVENDLWAMVEARVNDRRLRSESVGHWHGRLRKDLAWTLFHDFANYGRARRLAQQIGDVVLHGEDTDVDALIATLF